MSALDLRDYEFLELKSELERREHPEAKKLFRRYSNLAEHLFENELHDIDIGMHIDDDEDILYTVHGISHVLDVLDNIGRLLGVLLEQLTNRELYVLLCSALLHDYGNIDGREDHNKRPEEFMAGHPELFDSDFELQTGIVQVAQAHTGIAEDGSADTIADIVLGDRYRLLAAILRLADELADNSSRTYPALLERGKIPKRSLPHHQYCRAIKMVRISDFNIEMTVALDHDDIPLVDGKLDFSFLRFVDRRFAKTDMELRLASRYMAPFIQRITATVTVGMLENQSRIGQSVSLPFGDSFVVRPSFFSECSILQTKGLETVEELGMWLLTGDQ